MYLALKVQRVCWKIQGFGSSCTATRQDARERRWPGWAVERFPAFFD